MQCQLSGWNECHTSLDNRTSREPARWLWSRNTRLIACFLLVVAAGCRREQPSDSANEPVSPPAESSVATPEAPQTLEASVDRPAVADDPLAIDVPDGTPEELMTFLGDVAQRELRGATEEEQNQDIIRQMEARILASERLAQKEDGAYANIAAQTIVESLRIITAVGQPGAVERLHAYATRLESSSDERLAKLGRIGLYQAMLDGLITQGPGSSATPEQVIAALGELLDAEQPDLTLAQSANETAVLFAQVGLTDEALQAFDLVHQKFKGLDDPLLAGAALAALRQASLMRLGGITLRVLEGDVEAEPLLLDAARNLVDDEQPSLQSLADLLGIAQNIEFSGNVRAAIGVHDIVAAALPKLEESQAAVVKEMLASARQRTGLIGEPFQLSGVLIDQSPFDWEEYTGKVVLVDFWASWCGPCIEEIPNVLANYQRFHDAGFEVVGVNLDEDPEAAREFLRKNELPWESVISASDDARGFDDPNAIQHGVSAIPFLVLVNREGLVDSLHLRGDKLTQRLAELFPDVEIGDMGVDVGSPGEVPAEATAGDIDIETGAADDTKLDPPGSDTSTPVQLPDTTEMLPPDSVSQAAENPYLAPPDLNPQDLVLYLLELKDKPKSIQSRPGFRDALCDVVDRILGSSAPETQQVVAARLKLEYLHRDARVGNDEAQSQLERAVAHLKERMPVPMAPEIRLFDLEQKTHVSESDPEAVESIVTESSEYLEQLGKALEIRHLRLASNTVDLINRLPSELRDPHFDRVAKALMQSEVRDVSRYGKTLLSAASAPQLIGQKMELKGITAEGQPFDMETLQGRVFVVEFWATWCGACRKAQPKLQAELLQHEDARVVHVSLDADQKSLSEYLEKYPLPGDVLFGEEAQQAAQRYGVRKIPTYLVVDSEFHIQAVTHQVEQLRGLLKSKSVQANPS